MSTFRRVNFARNTLYGPAETSGGAKIHHSGRHALRQQGTNLRHHSAHELQGQSSTCIPRQEIVDLGWGVGHSQAKWFCGIQTVFQYPRIWNMIQFYLQMQFICSAEAGQDYLFATGDLSDEEKHYKKVLMADLNIRVVRVLCLGLLALSEQHGVLKFGLSAVVSDDRLLVQLCQERISLSLFLFARLVEVHNCSCFCPSFQSFLFTSK